MKINYKIFCAILVFWLFVGFVFLISNVLDALHYKPKFKFSTSIIFATLTIYTAWFLLTCLLYLLLRKPIENGNSLASTLIIFIALLLSLPVVTYLDHNTMPFFEGKETSNIVQTLIKTPYSYMFFNFLLFLLVTIICIGVIYQQHSKKIQQSASELKREQYETKLKLVSLRMQTLQSQLSPHFLFNSLSAISALSKIKTPEEVTDAITQLGDLLRYALSSSKKSLVSLDKEQIFISNYIYFQELRFNDRIEFNANLLDHCTNLVCPPFITQTLIENAVSHGMKSDSSMLIQIEISQSDDSISFVVKNSKSSSNNINKNMKGIGIGIENLNQRLKIIYGNNYSINSLDNLNEYVASVIVPMNGSLE